MYVHMYKYVYKAWANAAKSNKGREIMKVSLVS